MGAYGEGSHAGTVYVYHGSPDMPGGTADWTKRSNQAYAAFGFSVGTAGDVNADGYADIIVGAPYWDDGQTDEGGAWIYRGRAGGLDPTPYWYKQSDQAYALFGYSVGTAGDVNGDGYSDVIVGAPGYDRWSIENSGRAWVYHGSSTGVSSTPAWSPGIVQTGAQLGYAVGTAGDVNGDGYADVIVGAPFFYWLLSDEGAAWVYLGSEEGLASSPAWRTLGGLAAAQLGTAVGTAGDVNADGYSDVIVGAPYWEDDAINEGRVWVYHGSARGLQSDAAWHAESNLAWARMGHAAATAGDVNGDGYSDVIVAAPYWSDGLTAQGRVWVFHGSATGLSPTHAWARVSGRRDAVYGYSVATAGDVNGDGYADVLIGAPYMTGAGGAASEGVVCLYLGSSTGVRSTYSWTGQGGQTDARYGIAVAGAGDVNGDGYADLLIGASGYDEVHTNEGKAFAYYGNGRSGVPLRLLQVTMDGRPLAHLGRSDSVPFRLRMDYRNPFGRGGATVELEAKPLGVRLNGQGTMRGAWSSPLPGAVLLRHSGSVRPDTPYHWRVRVLYNPATTPWMPASRWVTIPWNGWNEQDLRTGGSLNYLPLVLRNN